MIERIPFKNFIQRGFRSTLSESLLSEMPIKPIRFQNSTGEYEPEQYHVISNLPIFMDWDDIYYLYQFPPFLWLEAAVYRYNKVLYAIKKHSGTSDVQDISLSSHGVTYIFKQRNTFAKKLLDKIERTVDVEHFSSQKEKTPEGKSKYQADFERHGKEGKDMSGFIGADLSDPVKTDVTGDDLWTSKGFMGIDPATFRQRMQEWIEASSHGMLGDTSEYGNSYNTFKSGGGQNADKELLTANATALARIAGKMIAAGAVPFKILASGSVFYENVKVLNRSGKVSSDGKFPEEKKDYTRIPVLLPGKAIDSASANAYEGLKTQYKNIKNINMSNVKDSDFAKRKIEEIRKGLNEGKYTTSLAKQNAKNEINKLMVHISFEEFLKQNSINPQEVKEGELDDLKNRFKRHLFQKKADIGRNAKAYDNYDWNFHRFNRERNSYDPVKTGVGNPFYLGDFKYDRLSDKTSRYGAYEANNQSRSMLHGEEGDWETHFKDIFGISDKESNEKIFKSRLGITQTETDEILREGEKYLSAIGRKLAANDEVVKFLEIDGQNAATILSSYDLITKKLAGKVRSLSDESIPPILRIAISELKSVNKAMAELEEDSTTGFTKSDIQKGVESALSSSAISNLTVLKTILAANKSWIILNSQNYIKRSLGEPSFIKLKKIFKNPKSFGTKEKFEALLDAKNTVFNLAKNYTYTISQLQFGSEDSLSGEGILSRRKREGGDNKKTFTMTSSSDDNDDLDVGKADDDEFSAEKGMEALSASGDDKRIGQRVDWADEANAFVDSFFGELGKSSARKWRPNSDSTTHKIGHNVSTMYELMKKEAEKAAQRVKQASNTNAKQLEVKNKSSVSHQEMQMLRSINNSLELFNFFVKIHKSKGLKGDSTSWAKDRMLAVLSRNNISLNQEPKELATSMRYAPADNAERDAVSLYDRLESEADSEEDLSQKIVDLSKKVDAAPNPQLARHIVDRLRILNSEPPIFDTYKTAASTSNVDVPQVSLTGAGLRDKLRAVANKYQNPSTNSVPGMGGTSVPTPETKPEQPVVPTPPAQPTQPTQPVQQPVANKPVQSMSLADRMKARRTQQ